jgi:hypothetical protein
MSKPKHIDFRKYWSRLLEANVANIRKKTEGLITGNPFVIWKILQLKHRDCELSVGHNMIRL